MNRIKILTEEDFKNIKDAKNIASKANKALENLKKDIAYLNNAKKPVCWKNNSINTYIVLIEELTGLKIKPTVKTKYFNY